MRLFAVLFIALMAPVFAQDEPVHMQPEFPLVFPLAQNGNLVTVKYPVMINPTTILKPGMQLRVIYILSVDDAGSTDLEVAHKGDEDQAYSRPPPGAENKIPTALAHEIEGYRRTVWQVANNFILAMAQYPTDSMHLIYSPHAKDSDLRDEHYSFFDGLFVGQPNGKVTVIAVEKQSYADQAGIKAGDEIISVGGNPTRDNLTTFALAYSNAKQVATDNETATYPMTVLSPGASSPHQVEIPMPPTLKGGLMDGFH